MHAARPLLALVASVLAALVLVGCPTDADDDDTPPPIPPAPERPVELAGPCPDQDRAGRFQVTLQPDLSLIDGHVGDSVWPAEVREPVASEGGCMLLRKRFPFCDPACTSGSTCDHDGSCIAEPRNQDVGVARIWGLAEHVAMEPVVPGNRYFHARLPHPGFDPDAAVHLDSSGGYAELRLEGRGVPPLTRPDAPIVVREGSPVALDWDAAAAVDGARIDLEFTIDQHGTSPLLLRCTFDDDGAAEVPAALIDQMMSAGISGYPNGSLARATVDSMETGDTCTELRVQSTVRLSVAVDGHTPCASDDDCPDPQTCDIPNQTCID